MKVYALSPPKPPFEHLWLKPLHIGMVWGQGQDGSDLKEWVTVSAKSVTRFKTYARLRHYLVKRYRRTDDVRFR